MISAHVRSENPSLEAQIARMVLMNEYQINFDDMAPMDRKELQSALQELRTETVRGNLAAVHSFMASQKPKLQVVQ